MKSSSRTMNQAGFSLIELMVVVAIIGILATVAIPSFTTFTNKAKQSEAKSALSAMYTGMISFRNEWGQFFPSFADIGYVPQGQAYYHTATSSGALAAPAAPFIASAAMGAGCITTTDCALQGFTARNGAIAPANVGLATVNTFTAGAGGTLTTADQWSINHNKVITHNLNGL